MANTTVNHWWESPIWEVDLGLDEKFNQRLLDEVYSVAKNIQTNIDSKPHDSLLDYDLPHIQRLKKLIHETITLHAMKYIHGARETDGLDIKFVFDFGWVNVKGPGERIEMHAHSDATITATYYIKVPKNSGNITFLDTSTATIFNGKYIKENAGLSLKSITPIEGSLVFFPAYMLHEVERNNSDELRISLTVDLKHVIDKNSPNAPILKSWVDDLLKIREWHGVSQDRG